MYTGVSQICCDLEMCVMAREEILRTPGSGMRIGKMTAKLNMGKSAAWLRGR
jgi:hypothetical protein